jgi:hypothetical protein
MRRLGFARENDTGVAPPEAGRRLTDKNNPMLWRAGHVADTRALLLRILVGEINCKLYAALVRRNSLDGSACRRAIAREDREVNQRAQGHIRKRKTTFGRGSSRHS